MALPPNCSLNSEGGPSGRGVSTWTWLLWVLRFMDSYTCNVVWDRTEQTIIRSDKCPGGWKWAPIKTRRSRWPREHFQANPNLKMVRHIFEHAHVPRIKHGIFTKNTGLLSTLVKCTVSRFQTSLLSPCVDSPNIAERDWVGIIIQRGYEMI